VVAAVTDSLTVPSGTFIGTAGALFVVLRPQLADPVSAAAVIADVAGAYEDDSILSVRGWRQRVADGILPAPRLTDAIVVAAFILRAEPEFAPVPYTTSWRNLIVRGPCIFKAKPQVILFIHLSRVQPSIAAHTVDACVANGGAIIWLAGPVAAGAGAILWTAFGSGSLGSGDVPIIPPDVVAFPIGAVPALIAFIARSVSACAVLRTDRRILTGAADAVDRAVRCTQIGAIVEAEARRADLLLTRITDAVLVTAVLRTRHDVGASEP
jgi:hypothetical protein